jgi:hypothetical protein
VELTLRASNGGKRGEIWPSFFLSVNQPLFFQELEVSEGAQSLEGYLPMAREFQQRHAQAPFREVVRVLC